MTRKYTLTLLAILLALIVVGFTQDQKKNQKKNKNVSQPTAEARVTIGPAAQSLSDTTALIAWSTNVSTDTVLHYGTQVDKLDQLAQAPWGGLTHRIQLKNLTPDTTYYYRVDKSAAQSTEPMSNPASFKTEPAKPAR